MNDHNIQVIKSIMQHSGNKILRIKNSKLGELYLGIEYSRRSRYLEKLSLNIEVDKFRTLNNLRYIPKEVPEKMGGLLDKPVRDKETDSGSGRLNLTWAVSAMQGWRRGMEDAHITNVDDLGERFKDCAVFGVYDGHGGKEVSEYVADNLPKLVRNMEKTDDLGKVLLQAYLRLDENMQKDPFSGSKYSMQGCTAVSCMMQGRKIVFANSGDSRAIVGTYSGEVRVATHDHKPNSPTERSRILAAGGTVDAMQGQYRVCQNLNLSRALGDLRYKVDDTIGPEKQIISGYPDTLEVELEDDDEWVILCCDGIWDVLTNEECLQYVQTHIEKHGEGQKNEQTLRACVEDLLDRVCSPDSMSAGTDNMTAILIALPNFREMDDAGSAGGKNSTTANVKLSKPRFTLQLPKNADDVEVYSNDLANDLNKEQPAGEVGASKLALKKQYDENSDHIQELDFENSLNDVAAEKLGSTTGEMPHSLVVKFKDGGINKKRIMYLADVPKEFKYDESRHMVLVY